MYFWCRIGMMNTEFLKELAFHSHSSSRKIFGKTALPPLDVKI